MTKPLTFEADFHVRRAKRGRVLLEEGVAREPIPYGRTPRVARLMALAIHLDRLVAEGAVTDYAEVARLGRVSRARVTQIVNLTLLAPDIQSEILFLPGIESGKDGLALHMLQPITQQPDWKKQRKMWREVLR